MAKEPVAGRVKKRLARTIGTVEATAVYRRILGALIARVGHDPRWSTVVAISPDAAVEHFALPPGIARVPQGGGDLGQRLARQFRSLPPGPVVVIGTDIPGIVRADIARAFAKLGSNDCVVGPSPDGGYWLIGLGPRARRSAAFAGVRWSSAHARADTLASLGGRTIAHVGEKSDVDTAADLARLKHRVGRRILT